MRLLVVEEAMCQGVFQPGSGVMPLSSGRRRCGRCALLADGGDGVGRLFLARGREPSARKDDRVVAIGRPKRLNLEVRRVALRTSRVWKLGNTRPGERRQRRRSLRKKRTLLHRILLLGYCLH